MRVLWIILIQILVSGPLSGAVPRTLLYQGRLLEEASRQPAKSIESRSMIFIFSEVGGIDLYSYTAENVSIRNGQFQVPIPIPDSLLFDKPYSINLILQGEGGGQTGPQPLKTVPYALTAEGTAQLGGVGANLYSLSSHVHTTSGGKAFTVDGTSSSLLAGDPQFTILDDSGSVLFRINASGDIERVRQVSADGLIETSGSLRVRVGNQERFIAENSGAVTVLRDVLVSGSLDLGSVRVSDRATLSDVILQKRLELGPTATVSVNNLNGNVMGNAHGLEEHAPSDLLTRLRSLTNGSIVTSGFHTHSFESFQITSTALQVNSIQNRHIVTGSLDNADIFLQAGILDSKLATISSTGKVTTQALPSSVVVLKNNNVFGGGFGAAGSATVVTTNFFDAVTASEVTVIAPLVLGTTPMLEFTNSNREFFWRLTKEGRLSLSVSGGAVEAFAIEVSDNQTIFDLKAVDIVLNEGTLFGGSSILNGSLSSTNLSSQTIRSQEITNLSIPGSKLASGSVTTNKLVPGAVTDEKIDGAPIRSAQILDGSIASNKIATNVLTGFKIRNQTLTNSKFVDNQISGSKFAEGQLGTQEIRDGSLTGNVLADATGAGLGSITGGKFVNATITDAELADEVFRIRSAPYFVGTTATNLTTAFVSLSSPQVDATLLKIHVPVIGGVKTPVIQMENQTPNSYSGSINLDSSISMRSQQMGKIVTVTPLALATLFGTPDSTGKCPVDAAWEYVAADLASNDQKNPARSGTGFCYKYVNQTISYKAAVNRCKTVEGINTAHLCSAMELRQACRKLSLNGIQTMVSDFAYGGGQIQKVTMSVSNGGGAACDLTPAFDSLDAGADRPYSCCYKPR
ncbi:MAG: hypothetical protein H3C47_00010 [Candidatus Cloacimonetes bacterium]|nr:hypothetical protein [Candidatus Cloacimonadota bacterium]